MIVSWFLRKRRPSAGQKNNRIRVFQLSVGTKWQLNRFQETGYKVHSARSVPEFIVFGNQTVNFADELLKLVVFPKLYLH